MFALSARSATDANYLLNSILPTRATIGVTQSVMTAGPVGLVDRGEVLEVKLTSGTLESVTMDALLSGANLAAIGDGSSDNWEVFQFADAQLVAPNTYWLKTRIRGQAGSDGLMPSVWPTGSTFVLLNGVPLQIELSPNLRRVAQNYRIGPARRGNDDPSYQHLVRAFDGNGLRPLSPVHLAGVEDENGDRSFAWIRRTRVDGDAWDAPDVPLGEESESYLVRVLQGETVLRELVVDSASWTYLNTEQAADGATTGYTISVAQISATYGPGLAKRLDIAA